MLFNKSYVNFQMADSRPLTEVRWGPHLTPHLTFFVSFEVRILTFFYVRNEVRSLNFLVRLRGKFVPQFSSIFNKTFFDLKNLMKILVFFWSKISNCCNFFAKKAFHRKYFCFFWRKIKILENINAQKHNKKAWGSIFQIWYSKVRSEVRKN